MLGSPLGQRKQRSGLGYMRAGVEFDDRERMKCAWRPNGQRKICLSGALLVKFSFNGNGERRGICITFPGIFQSTSVYRFTMEDQVKRLVDKTWSTDDLRSAPLDHHWMRN